MPFLDGMYDVPTLQRYCRDLCHQNADILLHLSRLLPRAQSKNPKVVMRFLMNFSFKGPVWEIRSSGRFLWFVRQERLRCPFVIQNCWLSDMVPSHWFFLKFQNLWATTKQMSTLQNNKRQKKTNTVFGRIHGRNPRNQELGSFRTPYLRLGWCFNILFRLVITSSTSPKDHSPFGDGEISDSGAWSSGLVHVLWILWKSLPGHPFFYRLVYNPPFV